MPGSLSAPEEQRSRNVLAVGQLGDFRRSSIHGSFRRCGKPGCACNRDGHPGHGARVRLSFRRRGKTVQLSLSDPAQLRKAEREVAAFRRLQRLSGELVEINQRICQLRPVEDLSAAPRAPE